MAIGDAAGAAGLEVFAASQDARLGYQNDNIRGDEIGNHIMNGTHSWSKITGKPATYAASVNSVGTAQVKDGAITDAKIKRQSITSGALATNSVGASELRSEAVRDQHIIDGAVRTNHFYGRAVGTDQLKIGSVYGGIIKDGGIEWDHLSSGIKNKFDDTSSIRYKEDVEDAVIDTEAILNLRPVTYHRKSDQTGEREFGLIAEEVQDAGATDLVVWRNEQIDGVRYDRLAVALLNVVKEQQQTIALLSERIDALETPEVEETGSDNGTGL